MRARGTEWRGFSDVFPPNIEGMLEGYWEKELGRLVHPLPEMGTVLSELREGLAELLGPTYGRT